MIQGAQEIVKIHYNKLIADAEQGETLDILLKKIKHRIVENISANTADNLGLSRAILCNDSLVNRLKDLEATENIYKGLVEHAKRMLKAYFDLLMIYKAFGDQLSEISVREPSARASEAFRLFGEFHRGIEKDGIKMIKALKPVISDFGTYLHKAIPDTKLTVQKYLDAKFSYLSYCLKVKEMDDEEHSFAALQEPLYRVETGNYEYRLILRCRQEARAKFSQLRNDVVEKIGLLEAKQEQDLKGQLERFIQGLLEFNKETLEKFRPIQNLFPIEIDLKPDAFQYNIRPTFTADGEVINSLDYVSQCEEATENTNQESNKIDTLQDIVGSLIPELESDVSSYTAKNQESSSSKDLLVELGLYDINLAEAPKTTSFDDFTEFFSASSISNTVSDKPKMSSQTFETDLLNFGSSSQDLLTSEIEPSTHGIVLKPNIFSH